MCGGRQLVKQLTRRSHGENPCKWRCLRHKPLKSTSGRLSQPFTTMEIRLVKDSAAAVEEQHGRDARQDFVVSTTIFPKGKRSSEVAYGCAGYSRTLLEQHAADEICLEGEIALGHAIGLLQRFTARTGIQLFIQPEIRSCCGTRHLVQFRLSDMRYIGSPVRFFSGPGGAPKLFATSLDWRNKPVDVHPLPRVFTCTRDVQQFIQDVLESGVMLDGPRFSHRTPVNKIEYIEAEQEHLPLNLRQEFTIFHYPSRPDGRHPWADRHGVGGGWREVQEQYPVRERRAALFNPGFSAGDGSSLMTRRWSAGRLTHPVVNLRYAPLREMFLQLTKDLERHFPAKPLVGMDTEGKRPISKVQLCIYSSVYIFDVSTWEGEQDFIDFLDVIRVAEGIIALDRDFDNGAPADEQDAYLLRHRRPFLNVVDLYAELTRNRWLPEDSYLVEAATGGDGRPFLRKRREAPIWSPSLQMMLDAVAPTRYFYVKPGTGIFYDDAAQESSGRSRWDQKHLPDELLVYAATDAVMTRNILKAIHSKEEPSTFHRQDKSILSFMGQLSNITGIPVPSYLLPWPITASASSPDCSASVTPASPTASAGDVISSEERRRYEAAVRRRRQKMKRRRELGTILAESRRRLG